MFGYQGGHFDVTSSDENMVCAENKKVLIDCLKRHHRTFLADLFPPFFLDPRDRILPSLKLDRAENFRAPSLFDH